MGSVGSGVGLVAPRVGWVGSVGLGMGMVAPGVGLVGSGVGLVRSGVGLGVEGLEELTIRRCKLDSLVPGSLDGLSRLQRLEVTTHNGEWAALAMEVVEGSLPLPLERVSLAHNNIWTLPPRALCGPAALHHLNLSHNRLQDVLELGFSDQVMLDAQALNMSNTSFSDQFSGFLNVNEEVTGDDGCGHALQELILDHNDLVRLPPRSFRALGGLRELYIRNNDVRLIASEAFRGMAALQVLYLSNNHIIALQNGTFFENVALERIYLNNNSLSALNSGVLQGLQGLQVVDLSHNKLNLDTSHEDLFKGLRRLVILDLSHNALSTITQLLLRDLTSLQRLDLSHNSIESLEDDSFTSLSNLYALDLSHNLILSLKEGGLRGLVGMSLLHLTNNSLIEIHPHALHHSSNLKEVFLGNNHLQAIPTALENLSFLKALDVSRNDIVSIQPFLFGGLGNLETLNVSYNKMNGISQGSFAGLVSLETLDMRDNQLRAVSEGSFDGVPSVRHLTLARNELTDINGVFAGLEHLESLDLSYNNIRMFDYAFIPRQLIKLDLKNNKIEQLGNFFKVQSVLTLEILDASYNGITRLTEVSLPNTIRKVILHNNNISRVLPNTFRDKLNLQDIDFRLNAIQRLNPKSISVRGTIGNHINARVSLAGNPFVCDCEMEWLYGSSGTTITTPEATEVIYLQPRVEDLAQVTCTLTHSRGGTSISIRILDTSPENYLCPYATHCFALCHCCDFIACDCQMKCPDACSCFHDDTWSMNLVDCSGGQLDRLPDRVPMDATVVLLDGNNLQVLHAHHFIGRHSIQQLFLNSSQIQTLQNRTFHGLTSLRTLHLQDNMIVQLNGFEFFGLHRLKELYLQNNRLSFVNNATFLSLKSLEVLRLDNNFIIDFPVWLLSNNRYLTSVSLANNPWDCDCQFVESLREWETLQPYLLLDPEEVFCVHSESGVVGPSIVLPEFSCTKGQERVTQYQFGQRQLPFLAGGLCGGVALISALVVVAMLVARRRAAAANKLAMSSPPLYCQEEDGKVFDAYISYSASDASYVRDVIATKLENSCPSYKLCLHSRDFSENSRLSEFITQSLNFSRRTIVVLSKNYVDNEWKNAIFKKAHVDGLKENDMNIIAIYYDNVSYSSFDAELKAVIRKCSKLRWGDKNFWKKLAEMMPQRQTYTGLPVYVSDNSYKSSTLPSLVPPSSLPLPSSSSVLTSTTGLTTPSEIDRRASYLPEAPATYKAPPPPRPCYSPPSCDYIVMQGRDCQDPQCTCRHHSHAAYTYVDGDNSSLHTYTSLEPFTGSSPHHPPTYFSRPHSPKSNNYSVIDAPIRRTVKASKRKKKRPMSQTCPPTTSEEVVDEHGDPQDPASTQPSIGTFRRTKSLRVTHGAAAGERQSDYSTDHSSDRSSGRSYDHSVTSAGGGAGGGLEPTNNTLYMGLTDSPPDPGLNTEECFV
ncbi:toll-like receptor Tollo [Homarus americanus]|uniref:toll-like receptor Tollo n=1 Tax=Homarus americanus TaxID=6706 RepID=UPI001C4456BE|nr:toll-like receptor Tollo [Homarus americanus]